MACREVSTWITENVLVPVERVITQVREACEQVRRWVEEKVWQPVESWVTRTEQRCREQDCSWWCLCCNKWFCWLVTLVVRIVTWVVVTVVKWVVYLVCKVVTVVVGIVIDLVLKVVARLVVIVVCVFTDPLKALSALWDLLNDVIDAVDAVFGLVVSLLDDVKEILNDVKGLVEGVGRSFCVYGSIMCAVFTALFGAIAGVIGWASDIVDWVQDVVQGVRDLVGGILSLDWCRIQRALGILNVVRVIGSVLRIPGTIFYAGPKALIDVDTIRSKIDTALGQAFAEDPDRLARARSAVLQAGSPGGLPCRLDTRRLAIESSTFLQELVTAGALDLHAIAGRFTACEGKLVYEQFDGEVVYSGTSTTVTKTDLDDFIRLGPDAVPAFTVYPITREVFRRHLETATRKGVQLGLRFNWGTLIDLPVTDSRFVPLASDDGAMGDAVQKDLLRTMGRPDEQEPLEVIPVIAVFGYVTSRLHGLTSWFRPAARPPGRSPTGTTFRSRFPEVIFQYVPVHEIGHYVGLDHDPHNSPGEIMWKPSQPTDWGAGVLNYLFTTGEANFTLDDVDRVWSWLTTIPQVRDRFLP
ncbi:MAG: hypothetical protein ACM3ZF_08325 [Mycobacterium leprae]